MEKGAHHVILGVARLHNLILDDWMRTLTDDELCSTHCKIIYGTSLGPSGVERLRPVPVLLSLPRGL